MEKLLLSNMRDRLIVCNDIVARLVEDQLGWQLYFWRSRANTHSTYRYAIRSGVADDIYADMKSLFGAPIDKWLILPTAPIRVNVYGGTVQDVQTTPGIAVHVYDYDVDELAKNDTDEHGSPCTIQVFPSTVPTEINDG